MKVNCYLAILFVAMCCLGVHAEEEKENPLIHLAPYFGEWVFDQQATLSYLQNNDIPKKERAIKMVKKGNWHLYLFCSREGLMLVTVEVNDHYEPDAYQVDIVSANSNNDTVNFKCEYSKLQDVNTLKRIQDFGGKLPSIKESDAKIINVDDKHICLSGLGDFGFIVWKRIDNSQAKKDLPEKAVKNK